MNAGRWVLTIPNWHPTPLNRLLGHPMARHRHKKADRNLIAAYALMSGIPFAICRRRVTISITLSKGQLGPDPDAWWKSLLDGLVHAKMLIDDDIQWCEMGRLPPYQRAVFKSTTITLEDIAPY